MKKITQGSLELFTTKEDAVNKLLQMQGICREKLSDANSIEFYCTKKGKITITDPPRRNAEYQNSTNLYARVVEQDGKTYVIYHTSYDKSNNVIKTVFIIWYIILAIIGIILAVTSAEKVYYLPLFVLFLMSFIVRLTAFSKEAKNSPMDSEILVNELKKRVEAVNLWDK